MVELVADNAISPFQVILWIFYPVGAIVFLELFLRAINGDDDDDNDGGKGIRIRQEQLQPAYVPSGA